MAIPQRWRCQWPPNTVQRGTFASGGAVVRPHSRRYGGGPYGSVSSLRRPQAAPALSVGCSVLQPHHGRRVRLLALAAACHWQALQMMTTPIDFSVLSTQGHQYTAHLVWIQRLFFAIQAVYWPHLCLQIG